MKRPGLTSHLVSATLFLAPVIATSLRAAEESMMTPPVDAKRDAAERAPTMGSGAADMLRRFDTNGDGKIDDDERADAHERMLKQQVERRMRRPEAVVDAARGAAERRAKAKEIFDRDGNGQLDETERAEIRRFALEFAFDLGDDGNRERLLARADTNGDGRLDEAERQAMLDRLEAVAAEAKKRRLEREKARGNR